MPTINQLPTVSQLSGADQFAVYDNGNGDARKVSVTALTSYMDTQLNVSQAYVQYESPLTGATIIVSAPSKKTWLLMTPAGTIATATLALPNAATLDDGVEVLVTSTEAVTALSFTLNGATAANGAPSTIAADGFFTLKFNRALNSWFRVA